MVDTALKITGYTLASALGVGITATLDGLQSSQTGLRQIDFTEASLDTWIGRVDCIEDEPVSGDLGHFDCRNNRLAQTGLLADNFIDQVKQLSRRYGRDRIGVFMGTSTSGIRQTELAYKNRDETSLQLPESFLYQFTHNVFSVADFSRKFLALEGPAISISTACSSSAKVFATASRYIRAGLCDAAIVGGVDSLCLTTLQGFRSLDVVSNDLCRPWDTRRKGINIGEAAGFAILEKLTHGDSNIAVLGYGESSDAYHMSTPHPQGLGASLAMNRALASANLEASQVDYVNLHGTATLANDRSEDQAIMDVFGEKTLCSSTKGWTGHTLGAAGITEAIIACLSIEHAFIPASLNTQQLDPTLSANIPFQNQNSQVDVVMSNSFGFGGNNCSLVIGKC